MKVCQERVRSHPNSLLPAESRNVLLYLKIRDTSGVSDKEVCRCEGNGIFKAFGWKSRANNISKQTMIWAYVITLKHIQTQVIYVLPLQLTPDACSWRQPWRFWPFASSPELLHDLQIAALLTTLINNCKENYFWKMRNEWPFGHANATNKSM